MGKFVASTSQKEQASGLVLGLLLTLAFAVIAFATWWFLKDTWLRFSALLWAFVYSIIAVNLIPALSSDKFRMGIEFSSTRLLRWTVALLGLTISASVWVSLGGMGLAVILINLTFAFIFGFLFCHYVLKMESTLSALIAVGTSICGASAIAAAGPALRAKAEQMGLSLAVITLFGLIAMFAYPLLFNGPLAYWLDNNPSAFGMWAGMGIHETAQVIAAGSQVDNAGSIAISAKSIRIFMIGPMVFASLFAIRYFSRDKGARQSKLPVPWFAVAFVGFTLVYLGLESLPIGHQWTSFSSDYIKPVVTFLLTWSFAAVGLKVKISAIRSIGLKAFFGGIAVALVSGGTALLLIKYVWMPFVG